MLLPHQPVLSQLETGIQLTSQWDTGMGAASLYMWAACASPPPCAVPTTSSSEGEASQERELKEICKQLFNVGILIPSVSYFQAFLPRRKSYKRFL